jgi:hypothetical protein
MGMKIEWPDPVDPEDKFLLDSRQYFEKVFREAFARRTAEWTAKVVQEKVTGITVRFFGHDGKPRDPAVFFSGMVGVKDVEDLTVFLPWP